LARQIGAREEFPRRQARARPQEGSAGGLEGSAGGLEGRGRHLLVPATGPPPPARRPQEEYEDEDVYYSEDEI